jgi:hypothetical protein
MLAYEVPLALWLIFMGVRGAPAKPDETVLAPLRDFGRSNA